MRCRAGDICVVVKKEGECSCHTGKIVQVVRLKHYHDVRRMWAWELKEELYCVHFLIGIEAIVDEALLPIRGSEEEEKRDERLPEMAT